MYGYNVAKTSRQRTSYNTNQNSYGVRLSETPQRSQPLQFCNSYNKCHASYPQASSLFASPFPTRAIIEVQPKATDCYIAPAGSSIELQARLSILQTKARLNQLAYYAKPCEDLSMLADVSYLRTDGSRYHEYVQRRLNKKNKKTTSFSDQICGLFAEPIAQVQSQPISSYVTLEDSKPYEEVTSLETAQLFKKQKPPIKTQVLVESQSVSKPNLKLNEAPAVHEAPEQIKIHRKEIEPHESIPTLITEEISNAESTKLEESISMDNPPISQGVGYNQEERRVTWNEESLQQIQLLRAGRSSLSRKRSKSKRRKSSL